MTYSSCLADSRAAYDIKEWTMHRFLGLGRTVTQLGMQLQRHSLSNIVASTRALVLGVIGKLGVIRAGCSLVTSCNMRGIRNTVR